MKQSRTVSGVITSFIVLAVIVYMAYYIFRALENPLKTVEAVLYTAEESVTVNGYFFRDEMALTADTGGVLEVVAKEGEKVAKNAPLIASYPNTDALDSHRHMEEIDREISLLQQSLGGQYITNIAKLDASISDNLLSLIYSKHSSGVASVAETASSLKVLILRRGLVFSDDGEQNANDLIRDLRAERAELEKVADGGTVAVRAPVSGLFTSSVDGYEDELKLSKTNSLTLSDLKNISSLKVPVPPQSCGRIVTDFEWRYAAVIPSVYLKHLSVGNRITLRFVGDYIGSLRVRILRTEMGENGEGLIVFSSTKLIPELLSLRRQNADIVFSTYTGIRIPKQALRIDENGNTGVYCLQAMQAVFVKTEQIYETDRHYIVKYDPSSEKSLRPGDEIIVSSKNLFDGKRVQ